MIYERLEGENMPMVWNSSLIWLLIWKIYTLKTNILFPDPNDFIYFPELSVDSPPKHLLFIVQHNRRENESAASSPNAYGREKCRRCRLAAEAAENEAGRRRVSNQQAPVGEELSRWRQLAVVCYSKRRLHEVRECVKTDNNMRGPQSKFYQKLTSGFLLKWCKYLFSVYYWFVTERARRRNAWSDSCGPLALRICCNAFEIGLWR